MAAPYRTFLFRYYRKADENRLGFAGAALALVQPKGDLALEVTDRPPVLSGLRRVPDVGVARSFVRKTVVAASRTSVPARRAWSCKLLARTNRGRVIAPRELVAVETMACTGPGAMVGKPVNVATDERCDGSPSWRRHRAADDRTASRGGQPDHDVPHGWSREFARRRRVADARGVRRRRGPRAEPEVCRARTLRSEV